MNTKSSVSSILFQESRTFPSDFYHLNTHGERKGQNTLLWQKLLLARYELSKILKVQPGFSLLFILKCENSEIT